jgi:hypothetical protein
MVCYFYAAGNFGSFYTVDMGAGIPVVGNFIRARNSDNTADILKGKILSVHARWRIITDTIPVWYAAVDTTQSPPGGW